MGLAEYCGKAGLALTAILRNRFVDCPSLRLALDLYGVLPNGVKSANDPKNSVIRRDGLQNSLRCHNATGLRFPLRSKARRCENRHKVLRLIAGIAVVLVGEWGQC
jgi:hypothetical protein